MKEKELRGHYDAGKAAARRATFDHFLGGSKGNERVNVLDSTRALWAFGDGVATEMMVRAYRMVLAINEKEANELLHEYISCLLNMCHSIDPEKTQRSLREFIASMEGKP